ncbi:MAG: hypothetical protein NZM25_01150 [Leptospiraceae bacterium]|nr:hypothetical protein [Leptospiraceae bacterium]MDW8306331.1 hypothetical protein [Leptospiraceae bacterium]
MEGIGPTSGNHRPAVMSSEELKALLYLTLRGHLKIPEETETSQDAAQKDQQVDLKA